MRIPFFALGMILFLSALKAQNASIQDCIGAIPICQKIYVESQAPEGRGNIDEINPDFNCMRVESNSIWYSFTVNNSGNFGFLLTPKAATDDYDWALFNLTNASCGDLYTDPSLIVSCNAAGGGTCDGPTGANGNTSFSVQGAGCDAASPNVEFGRTPYNALIPVQANNTYVLVVSNWTGSTNGYTIDFGLSSDIGIFDEEAPYIESAGLANNCDGSTLEVHFSEFVQCSSVDAGDFALEGPGGPYTLAPVSADCSTGSNFTKTFLLQVSPPMIDTGTYQLNLISSPRQEVLDLCDNPAAAASYPMVFDALDVPVNLGDDVTYLCVGEPLLLEVGAIGASVQWHDNATDTSRIFTVAGTYSVTVTTACGTNSDAVTLSYVSQAPTVNLGSDIDACPGEEFLLRASGESATYLWQDNSTSDSLLAVNTGTYSVTVTNACGEDADELNITYEPPLLIDLGRDTFLCEEEKLDIQIRSNATDYLWQDGNTFPDYAITTAGTYILQASNDCETVSDTLRVKPCLLCEIQAPNVFSPNADGSNDRLVFYSNCEIQTFDLKIFSRWGELMFESKDPQQTWDGNSRGEPNPAGVYVWVIAWEGLENGQLKSFTHTGSVALIR